MKILPECFPCLMRQTLNTVQQVTTDKAVQAAVLREVAAYMAQANADVPPAKFSQPMYAIVAQRTGVADPFDEVKRQTNALALQLLPEVSEQVRQSHDPLGKALHAAAAGNVIDAVIRGGFDVHADMLRQLRQPFQVNDLPVFRNMVKRGSKVLYLADNAGEIIFDALVVEQIHRLGAAVTVAVKSGPIINDAMMADAMAAGLPNRCTVMETGSADIGVNWDNASAALRATYDAADVVLAKGHGHFETLFDARHLGLFFLLKAKCPVVANVLNCNIGDLAFIHAAHLHA
jgi:hypothetical protein